MKVFILLLLTCPSVPYDSLDDLYDAAYDDLDNDISEDIPEYGTPVFVSRPVSIVANNGSTVRLPCIVDYLAGFVLLWRLDNNIVAVGDEIIQQYEDSLYLESVADGNYLVIKEASQADEGEYSCSVSALSSPEITHSVRLRVAPVLSVEPVSPVVLEGESVSLSCLVLSGYPPPRLCWRIPGDEQEHGGGMVRIERVGRDDAGVYVCQADNGGTPVTQSVRLEVQYIPSIKIVRSDDSREEMTLTCIVDSHPPADISWRKDGREVSVKNTHSKEVSNKNIHSREVSGKIVRSQSETAATTIIYMKNLDRDNFGAYTCIAENSLGREELTTYISGWPEKSLFSISLSAEEGPMINITVASHTTVKNMKVVIKSEDNKHWHELLLPATRLMQHDDQLVHDNEHDQLVHDDDDQHDQLVHDNQHDLPVHANPHQALWTGQSRLPSLASGTLYSVSVASSNNFGFSPFSQPYSFTTPPRTETVTSAAADSSYNIFIIFSLSLLVNT